MVKKNQPCKTASDMGGFVIKVGDFVESYEPMIGWTGVVVEVIEIRRLNGTTLYFNSPPNPEKPERLYQRASCTRIRKKFIRQWHNKPTDAYIVYEYDEESTKYVRPNADSRWVEPGDDYTTSKPVHHYHCCSRPGEDQYTYTGGLAPVTLGTVLSWTVGRISVVTSKVTSPPHRLHKWSGRLDLNQRPLGPEPQSVGYAPQYHLSRGFDGWWYNTFNNLFVSEW